MFGFLLRSQFPYRRPSFGFCCCLPLASLLQLMLALLPVLQVAINISHVPSGGCQKYSSQIA